MSIPLLAQSAALPSSRPLSETGARPRVAALDGLRGLAVLLVITEHMLPWGDLEGGALGNAIAWACSMGWIGIELFFVLSGFLITGLLLQSRGRSGYFSVFWGRRVLRILPVYLLLLGFVYLMLPLLPAELREGLAPARLADLPVYLFAVNLFPLLELEPHRFLLLTWSLAVEQQFYLLWPFLCRWLSAPRLLALALGILTLEPLLRLGFTLFGADASTLYFLGYSHADGLAAGAAIASARHILRSPQPGEAAARERARLLLAGWRQALPWLCCGTLAMAVLAGYMTPAHGFADLEIAFRLPMLVPGYNLLALMFGALLLRATEEGSRLNMLLQAGALSWIGRISYSLYLVHVPVALLAANAARAHGWPLSGLATAAAAMPVAILLAGLLHGTVEKPFMDLGQRLRHAPPA